MTEYEFEKEIANMLKDKFIGNKKIINITCFFDAYLPTLQRGIIITLDDGSNFHLPIMKG